MDKLHPEKNYSTCHFEIKRTREFYSRELSIRVSPWEDARKK